VSTAACRVACTQARTRDLGASLAIERANLNDWLILILPKPTALVKEQAMQIVDAQIHLWSTGLPSNPTHWPLTHFTAEEAIVLMDDGGIDAAVIHPPDWDPGSMELALRAVRGHPGRFAIMASLPLDHSGSRARIAGWRKPPACLAYAIRSWPIQSGNGSPMAPSTGFGRTPRGLMSLSI
jgi:hypothetical protein